MGHGFSEEHERARRTNPVECTGTIIKIKGYIAIGFVIYFITSKVMKSNI